MERYVKILRPDLYHKGFQYHPNQINTDTIPFNPSGTCEPGGLYFTTLTNFPYYLYCGTMIADVVIPKDAKLYEEKDKLKADKIIIKNIRHISELKEWTDEKFQLEAVIKNRESLRYIVRPSEKVQLAAVNNDGYAIEFLPDADEKIQLAAVRQNAYAIRYIQFPSPSIQLAAIQKEPRSIRFIRNPYPGIESSAITSDTKSFRDIRNPTLEMRVEYAKTEITKAFKYLINKFSS